MLEIDKILEVPERSLHAYKGKLLFGPVGERLFCDCLEKKPGFCGHVDFIHKMNIDQLFTVQCDTEPDFVSAKSVWHPSRLEMSYEDEEICFHEIKTIANEDIAIAAQTWKNCSDRPVHLTLVCQPSKCPVEQEDGYIWMQMPEERNTIQVGAAIMWDAAENFELTLQPAEEVSFTIAAATGNILLEEKSAIVEKIRAFFGRNCTPQQYILENEKTFGAFFDKIPTFECSDPVLNKTWFYRWYILRHCTAKPNQGYLKHATVYEGRGHKTGKGEALKVNGWEFSRMICLSTPLQMMDYKWCPDKEFLHEVVRGYFENEDENGICQSCFVHHKGSPFANFMVWAVYQMYLVDGDKEFVKEILPLLKKCVDGNTAVYGAKNDNMQIEVKHQRTGKEFQPSYWYFTDFPVNGKDKSKITPLKRMDTSVYHYLNNKGLYKLMEAVGDENAAYYKEFADTLAEQINEKAWDDETKFYYDLHHETDEKALVKNIVGFYPYWAEFAGEEQMEGIEYLFDPDYFNTGEVFATTAKDCVAFAPAGGWMGSMRSRNGCVWDGPSWPYTNGIMLDMIGKQTKAHNHKYDAQFAQFLRAYSLQHYTSGDLSHPYLVEQYHALTGEPLSDEPDYNHSYYLELLIAHVAGLSVQENQIVVDPVDIGLKYFDLDHIFVRGHQIRITYAKKMRETILQGLHLYVDGKEVAGADTLTRLEWNI